MNRAYKRKQYHTLNALRAVAFLGVSFFHRFGHLVPGGYLAVIIFLTLSGFLTLAAYDRKRPPSFKKSLIDIWRKFVKLLSPVYFIMAVSLVVGLFFAREIFDDSIRSVIPVALNFENIARIIKNDDYFNQLGNFNIFLHMWYVSMYMQFMAIFILINQLIKKRSDIFKLFIFGLLTILSFYAMFFFANGPEDISRIYYGIDTRFSAFSIGGFLYLLNKVINKNKNSQTASEAYIIVLSILTIIPFFVINGREIASYRGFFIWYTVVVGMLILACYNYESKFMKQRFRPNILYRLMLYVGSRSYFLYLWQYIVQIYAVYFLNFIGNTYIIFLVETLALFILAEITYLLFKHISLSKVLMWISTIVLVGLLFTSHFLGNQKDEEIEALRAEITANEEAIRKRNEELKKQRELEDANKAEEPVEEAETEKGIEEEVEEIETVTLEDEFEEKPYDDFDFTEAELDYLDDLKVVSVGDSIIINADYYIRQYIPEYYLDGEVARDMIYGPGVLQNLIYNVGPGDIYIIALGSNGSANESDMQAMLDMAEGADVYFVNTYHTQSYMDYVNTSIRDFVDKHDNAYLVEWYEFVNDKPELLAADRTHPTGEGASDYAKLIMRKILNVNKVNDGN